MKKRIFAILLFCLVAVSHTLGQTVDSPINRGTWSAPFTDEFVINAATAPDNIAYYNFTIQVPLDITISHCNSTVSSTAIFLLDSNFDVITVDAGNNCSTPGLSVVKTHLEPGTYTINMDWGGSSGQIRTVIEGELPGTGGETPDPDPEPEPGSTPAFGVGSKVRNYIQTRSYTNASGNAYLDRIDYFDEMGRAEQSVSAGASPTKGDLITLTEYDAFGRVQKSWLPGEAVGNAGKYITPATQKSKIQTTNGGDSNPYSLTEYELSPLNRPMRQYGAGNAWQANGKAVKTEYGLTNISGNTTMNCVYYTATQTAGDTIVTIKNTGNYTTGSLRVERTTDEDGNAVLDFKDRMEKVVLSRAMEGSILYDTYYIYDAWGNLQAVLPPLAADGMKTTNSSWVSNVNTGVLKEYAYLYVYDKRNRMVGKRLPGQCWMRSVYDLNDYPVLTQDGVQRERGEWKFSIPDALGRASIEGICKNSFSGKLPELSTTVKATRNNATDAYKGYTIAGISLSTAQVLLVNYYDNYNFMGKNGIPASTDANYKYESVSGYGTQYSGNASSMLTGKLTAKLDGASSLTYLPSVMYYDYRKRLIQSKEANHLSGGIEKEYLGYDFMDHVLARKHVHSATGKSTQTEVYTYAYDHAGRLLTAKHSLNGGSAVTLADNEYDSLGRLKANKRNGIAALKTNHTYNVRSWTKSITNPLFSQTLYYNDKRANSTNTAYYSGNVSAMDWKVNATGDNIQRGYDFAYDGLSRLTQANYLESSARNTHFNTSYTYDKHGNILTLQRNGQTGVNAYGLIDNLTFVLAGSRLKSVNDASTVSAYNGGFEFKNGSNTAIEYTYDANGNLTKDSNKGIAKIQYNFLALPSLITLGGTNNSISYLYGANGKKLKVTYRSGVTEESKEYCGNVVYENGVQKLLLIDGGYINLDGTRQYHFYLKDHQGNNRIVASAGGSVEERSHYYPFGGTFANSTNVQPYKYNGKELDTKKGLNWYDYGARHYDAALGRFTTVDPFAENMYSWSPYTYCLNNPAKYVDKDGNFPWVAGLVGGGIDYGFQVAANKLQGKSWGDSFTDIDMKSVLVSAATSMTGVGLGNVVSKGITLSKVAQTSTKVAQVAKVAGEVAVDATMSAASQMSKDGEVNTKQVVADVVFGQTGGKVGDKVMTKAQTSETGKMLHRQADHARRVAGNSPRPSRAQKANEAIQKAQHYGEKTKIATSTAISTAGSESVQPLWEVERDRSWWSGQSAIRKYQ